MSSNKGAEKLDLSSLRSFSPEWSASLRFAVCIATQYAGERLVERSKALLDPRILKEKQEKEKQEQQEKQESEKAGEETEQPQQEGGAPEKKDKQDQSEEPQVGEEIVGEEEKTSGSQGKRSKGLGEKIAERKRHHIIAGWEDFCQKYLTATCQHLGVDEQALPAGPLSLKDVLEAGQGRVVKKGTTEEDRAREEEMLDSISASYETGSFFWRRNADKVTRSEVAEDVKAEQERTGRMEAVRDKAKTRYANVKRRTSGSGNSSEEEEEARRIEQEVAAEMEQVTGKSQKEKEKVSFQPLQREGGALTDDFGRGREIEVYNELLLVALGLGQYRSKDGSTTLFEQEALFDQSAADSRKSEAEEKTPPTTGVANLELDAEEGQQQHDQQQHDQRPQPQQGAEPVSGGAKAWKSFSNAATTSWKWTAEQSKKSAAAVESSFAPQRAKTTADFQKAQDEAHADGSKKRARKPVKPNEICHYDSRARALILTAGSALGLETVSGFQAEKALAQTIYFVMSEARQSAKKQGHEDPLKSLPAGSDVDPQRGVVAPVDTDDQGDDEEDEEEDASQAASGRTSWMNKAGNDAVTEQRKMGWKKWAVAGGGFALGGVVLGVTGGLAAPLIVPTLAGITGVTFLATSGGVIMMGTLFGITGGGLAGYKVHRRLRGLKSFTFEQVDTPARQAGLAIPSLHATICVSGILLREQDQVGVWEEAWGLSSPDTRDVYVVSSEAQTMTQAGKQLRSFILSSLTKQIGQKAAEEAVKRTAFAALTAVTLPMTVAGAISTGLDSIFVRAKAKATKQGLILADTIKREVQGHRPVTLIGCSLGGVAIITCLNELAKGGEDCLHLVDSVYLIGTPSTVGASTLRQARSAVCRRFVNAYSRKDMVCGIAAWIGLEMSTEDIKAGKFPKVIGANPVVGVPGMENVDVGDLVDSHFDLCSPEKVAQVCRQIGAMDA